MIKRLKLTAVVDNHAGGKGVCAGRGLFSRINFEKWING
jgi:hypothetical protein